MAKRLLLTISAVLILLTIAVGSIFAGSISISGTIDVGDPTMPVVFITSPNCTGQGVSPVLYEVQPFNVDAAGVYTLTLDSVGGFASLYLYVTSFVPTDGVTNCIAADNSGNPIVVSFSLDPALNYFAVPFDDTFAQLGGGYTLTIDGPGNPYQGTPPTPTPPASGTPGPTPTLGAPIPIPIAGCRLPIPEGSVVGEAPFGAQVYYEPGNVSPGVILNPGTYHVIGQDATETYYKIFFNCQYLWVLKNLMQPSYLPPQNGAPLPQRIVS